MAKQKRNKAPKELMEYLFDNYELKSAFDVQEALKDMFSDTLETMLNAEIDEHLGYSKNNNASDHTTNRRNGKTVKTVNSQLGDFTLNIPRDRESSFEPQVVEKHQRDISGIEDKILSMYAKGQLQRDISATIQEIYGFDVSHETVSKVTDKIIPLVQDFRNRQQLYPFVYVDAMYAPVKTDNGTGQKALYNIIGIDIEGRKDILGFWLSDQECSRGWLAILEEIKQRGVEDILFISLDGLTGLEQAIKAVYPKTITQRCIVHLMRNSTRYIARKNWAAFAKDIKAVYRAVSLDEAKSLFEVFESKWASSAAAVNVWKKNWDAIEHLFDYPQEIRKIIYTTNTIESYHNQLRKVTDRKGAFPNKMSLYKLIYLRSIDIKKTWLRPVQNCGQVMNQLQIFFPERILSHMKF